MKQKNIEKTLTLIFIFGTVLTLFFSGVSIGKGYDKNILKVNAKIAKPIFKVENNQTIAITKPEQEGMYEFKIKNYNENDEVTQVDLEYYVEIIHKPDESINLTLLKNNEQLRINENKTDKFLMCKEKKQEDNFKLKIKIASSINEENIKQTKIKVNCKQREGYN